MNAHQQAIQIMEDIYSGKRDAMSCLFTLCRVEPDAMVRALDPPLVKRTAAWTDVAMTHLHNGNMVSAIKEVRTHRGLGLKQAKDIVDEARNITDPYAARDWLEKGCVPQASNVPEPSVLGSLIQKRIREMDNNLEEM